MRRQPSARLSQVRDVKLLAVAAVVLAYAWWATQLRPFAATTGAAVVGAGAAAMAFGAHHRRRSARRLGVVDVAVWATLLGALAAWQVAAYLQHPRSDHPTLSSLANALLDTHPARALAFLVWLAGAARLARA